LKIGISKELTNRNLKELSNRNVKVTLKSKLKKELSNRTLKGTLNSDIQNNSLLDKINKQCQTVFETNQTFKSRFKNNFKIEIHKEL
jgi:hypothetical protein